MNKINAKIVADSISPQGHRITSMLLTYPRFIHSELMTHRMFSRNSASSRAIPFEKMVKMVEEDPFTPIAWQKNHKGMQGTEYFTNEEAVYICVVRWLAARDEAVFQAEQLNKHGATKQICNRLLEPFMWHTVLVTATEWENFFELRCPQYTIHQVQPENNFVTYKSWKDLCEDEPQMINYSLLEKLECNKSQAEIHIQALAEAMWDAMNESTPIDSKDHLTRWKEYWHIPFITPKVWEDLGITYSNEEEILKKALKISTARCARLSYMTFDGEIDYEKDIKLHDYLLESHHMSPFEHVARCMTELEYYSFVKGQVPSTKDYWGILNYEYYPYFTSDISSEWFEQPKGEHKNNGNRYGWCNNFRGFIPYRYLIED